MIAVYKIVKGVAKQIDNGTLRFLYRLTTSANSTSNTNALINGIGFNSGVAMLATRNKVVYMPHGMDTIYLKLLLLLWKVVVIASAPQIRHGIIAGNV